MSGTAAGGADPGEDLRERRKALAESAPKLKDGLRKLAVQFKVKADNIHRDPPEDEATINDLRRELRRVYDELKRADRELLDVAPIILEDRYDQRRLGIAKAQLRAFLNDVFGDADTHLSAAVRIAAQHGSAGAAPGAGQAESAFALARRGREAANAYLRFAETFEVLVEVIGGVTNSVSRAESTAGEGTAGEGTAGKGTAGKGTAG